jgi:hypothetical protein
MSKPRSFLNPLKISTESSYNRSPEIDGANVIVTVIWKFVPEEKAPQFLNQSGNLVSSWLKELRANVNNRIKPEDL